MSMNSHFPPRSILVPLDGSLPSWAGLEAACTLAKRLQSRIEAVLVEELPPPVRLNAPLTAINVGAVRREFARRAASLEPGRCSLEVASGRTVVELERRASPSLNQIVVMGTHAREGAERFLMGSNAETLFHHARVPVLAVREKTRLELRRVLVPWNGEAYADEALLYAARLARAFAACVTVLYVAPAHSKLSEAESIARARLERVLGSALPGDIGLLVVSGEPRREIESEARRSYDLVALSAHRREQLSDLALGTTAERLLRHCARPVLAVPA